MNYDCGILDGLPRRDEIEMLILAHTPGIPLEWVYAGLHLSKFRRRTLVQAQPADYILDAARENAASITLEDGWRMLTCLPANYAGAVPLHAQLYLKATAETDVAIARTLGVDRKKVGRWRTTNIFCPLTGVRLIPNRGRPIQ